MQRIGIGELEFIISKLKLKRPAFIQQNRSEKQRYQSNLTDEFSFSKQEQSVVQDNYSDSNCFSLQNLQNPNGKKLSLPAYLKQEIQMQLGQFDSIIDKLKTQGDMAQPQEFMQYQKLDLTLQNKTFKQIDRQSYFSQQEMKLHSKSYKNISSMKKKKTQQPISIAAKLVIDKQNFHIYSNQSHHSSVKKLKKTFNFKGDASLNSISSQKIRLQKTINSKIQTQRKYCNEVKKSVSKSQLQCKTTSPLPFRHSKIEPHKFSSYKMKLF